MGEEDTAAWDGTVQEWLVDGGKVWAGGVCSIASGCRFFGVAHDQPRDPDNPEAAWLPVVKSGYKIDVTKPDGTVESVDCDESETIRQAIVDGKAPNGVYIGGVKYQLTEIKRDFENNGQNYDIAILGRTKGGGFLIKTPNDNVAVALFDEEKEQNKADALGAALLFADYLYQGGF